MGGTSTTVAAGEALDHGSFSASTTLKTSVLCFFLFGTCEKTLIKCISHVYGTQMLRMYGVFTYIR